MPSPSEEYWTASDDPYLDPATGLLRNLQNFTTQSRLDAFEEIMFQSHLPEAASYCHNIENFSFQIWADVHAICFGDVYDWAGEARTVRLKKGDTVFGYPEYIMAETDKIFGSLMTDLLQGRFNIDSCAYYYGELNVIHPFREGNGRTQRILFSEIARRAGYEIDYTKMETGEFIQALIASYHSDNTPLKGLFRRIMRQAL